MSKKGKARLCDPASWLPLASAVEFTQPTAYGYFDMYVKSVSKVLGKIPNSQQRPLSRKICPRTYETDFMYFCL